MELLPILRSLSRRRLILGVGLLAAILVLVGLGGTKPTTRSSPVAWTSVSLDTPKSQLVYVAPSGADTLPWRASLLTHLLATPTLTAELARKVGVAPDKIMVADPNLDVPLLETTPALDAEKAASTTAAPYVVTPFVKDSSLPVISIEAVGPDRAGAVRLAQAAVAVLQSQASPGGKFTSPVKTNAKVSRLQPFVVDQVAPIRAKVLTASKPPIKAIGGALFIFVIWCAGVVLVPRRRDRRAAGREAALPA